MRSWPCSSQIITRDLLTALDSSSYDVEDRAGHLEFLAQHIAHFRPRQSDGTLQTVESLEDHLMLAIKRHRRDGNTNWETVFASRSKMVHEAYWKHICRYAATERLDAGPRVDATLQPPNLPDETEDAIPETENKIQGPEPLGSVPSHSASKGTSKRRSQETDDSAMRDTTGPAAKVVKLSTGSTEHTAAKSMVEFPSLEADRSPASKISKGPSDMVAEAAAAASRHDHKAKNLPAATLESGATNARSRIPTRADAQAGRIKAPIVNVRERLAPASLNQDDIAGTVRALWPPEDQHPGTTNNRLEERGAAMAQLGDTMRKLGDAVLNMPKMWCINSGIAPGVEAIFVERPGPELENLYRSILDSNEWQWTLMTRRAGTNAWSLPADVVMSGMIASYVGAHVLDRRPPWDIEQRIHAASGTDINFGEESMEDKGHDLDDLLRQWSFKMHNDPDFAESTIKPYARKLTADLAETMAPHLSKTMQGQEQKHATGSADIEWLESLMSLIQNALIFHGKAQTYGEVSVGYTWCKPGSKLNHSTAKPLYEAAGTENEVVLNVWPGVELTSRADLGHVSRTVQNVLTTVHARPWPEMSERS